MKSVPVYIELIGVAIFIVVLWIILKRSSISHKALKIHHQPVHFDEIEEHVIRMAAEHSVSDKRKPQAGLFPGWTITIISFFRYIHSLMMISGKSMMFLHPRNGYLTIFI